MTTDSCLPPPPTAPDAPPPPPTADAPSVKHAVKTVFVIVMENTGWSQIQGSSAAPYINGTLLPMASYATQYFNPPGNHPSEPNYLWLEGGQSFGVTNDNDPSSNHIASGAPHLVQQLADAGVSWKAYEEDIDGKTCPLTAVQKYAPKHDPFVYFDDVTGSLDPNNAYCIEHVRPFGELASDLAAGTVARYNFITPNLCDDMHDICSPTLNAVRQGDDWLAATVPAILASPAYQDGGALFITWDEGFLGDGPIGMILLSPLGKGGGYPSTIHYTHSSTLRTLQEIFDVRPFLGDAANATDLADLFQQFP